MQVSEIYPATLRDGPRAGQLLALFAVTAAMLAYEVALARLIAIQHWYHLAPLIIALALLGFGTAGTVASLFAEPLRRRARGVLFGAALLLSLSIVGGGTLSGLLPLNMLALPWQSREILHLLLYSLLLLPAFFAGGLFITVYFLVWPHRAGRVYAWDLLGSASGALGALLLIAVMGLESALLVLALLPLAAALWIGRHSMALLMLCGFVALLAIAAYPQLSAEPADYKAQATRQLERDARLLAEEDGVLHRLTVLESPGLHAAPGLSLNSRHRAPEQWQLFLDGDSPTPLLREEPPTELFQQTLGYAPYLLAPSQPRVLLLDAANLWPAWIAAAAEASRIRALTPDRTLIRLLERLRDRAPAGIHPEQLQLHHSAARRYLQGATERHDVAVLTVAGPEAGIAASQEDYRLTREALRRLHGQLSEHGVLAVQVRLHSLPRESLRVVSMLAELLDESGHDPARHIAVLSDWRSAVIIAGRSPIGDQAARKLAEWAQRWHFDAVALPGHAREELPVFHASENDLDLSVNTLLSERAASFRADYWFELSTPTDNRPFFHQFFRWQTLGKLRQAAGPMWHTHVEWGYLLNLSAWAGGAVLAALLLALPFALARQRPQLRGARRPLGYFLGIGLGFMLVEISLLHKAALLLDGTAVALSTVLAATLLGAGLGSLWQQYRQPGQRALYGVFALIALLALAALPAIDALLDIAADWPLAARMAAIVGVILVMSLPMGIPLPHAIQRLREHPPAIIAWAWAVNGFASVLGTLGAVLIAMHFGLLTVMAAGIACYGLAALCSRDWRAPPAPT